MKRLLFIFTMIAISALSVSAQSPKLTALSSTSQYSIFAYLYLFFSCYARSTKESEIYFYSLRFHWKYLFQKSIF